uniref:Uncharacterized protein n=1 Tax=uncultured marine virus TaxID=186617 RepID=A0A0F7L5E2_9VIRU|nr:hypothetical protein [uncultured marine virus]
MIRSDKIIRNPITTPNLLGIKYTPVLPFYTSTFQLLYSCKVVINSNSNT